MTGNIHFTNRSIHVWGWIWSVTCDSTNIHSNKYYSRMSQFWFNYIALSPVDCIVNKKCRLCGCTIHSIMPVKYTVLGEQAVLGADAKHWNMEFKADWCLMRIYFTCLPVFINIWNFGHVEYGHLTYMAENIKRLPLDNQPWTMIFFLFLSVIHFYVLTRIGKACFLHTASST